MQLPPGPRPPAAASAAPAAVARRAAPLPAAVFGIDKAEAPESAWLRELYDASNLRLTGAYIDGPALAGHTDAEFTSPSRTTTRHWMARVPQVSRDGWGTPMFYLGYSAPDASADRSVWPPTGQPTVDRARLHAQHLKHIIATNIPGWAGAVVYIDNENAEQLDLNATALTALRDYYLALFDELVRPGPDGAPPMRPGVYLHAPVARPLLRARPDLFVWDVQIDVADPGVSTTTRAPFDTTSPARLDVTLPTTIRAAVVPADTGPAWTAWPVGRQFRFYTGLMPTRGSPVTRAHPGLTPISTFDFDCSLVQDPAYPVAGPRLAVISGRAEPTAARGTFADPVRTGADARPATMTVAVVGTGPRPVELGPSPGAVLEPDAPLLAVPAPLPDTLLSVTVNGTVVERRLVNGAWTAWAIVGHPAPSMRRLRTIAAVKRPDGTTYLVTVSTDHRLYAQRRVPGGDWSEPAPMAGAVRLHPFSTVSATLRGTDQIEVLATDTTGNLVNAWWTPLLTAWPGDAHAAATRTPATLVGSALAVASPNAASLLVFGVGRDLRLTLVEFRAGTGWLAPRALGQVTDRLTAHSRPGAQVASPNLIEVAGISTDLALLVYQLRFTGGQWTSDGPTALSAIPAATPPTRGAPAQPTTPGPTEAATGWSINPFGDVALGRTAGARSFVVAAATAAVAPRTAAVGSFLDGQPQWWRYR